MGTSDGRSMRSVELTASTADANTSDAGIFDTELAERCKKAPRYGVNAKFLLLQAASSLRSTGQDYNFAPFSRPEQAAKAPALDKADVPSLQSQGGSPDGPVDWRRIPVCLRSLVAAAECPFVEYRFRQKVPRNTRQAVADKLGSQYLSMLAAKRGACTTAQAEDIVRRNAELRDAARKACLAQELRLYLDSTSKLDYQGRSGRAVASENFLEPVPSLSEQPSGSKLADEAAKPADTDGEGEGEMEHSKMPEVGEHKRRKVEEQVDEQVAKQLLKDLSDSGSDSDGFVMESCSGDRAAGVPEEPEETASSEPRGSHVSSPEEGVPGKGKQPALAPADGSAGCNVGSPAKAHHSAEKCAKQSPERLDAQAPAKDAAGAMDQLGDDVNNKAPVAEAMPGTSDLTCGDGSGSTSTREQADQKAKDTGKHSLARQRSNLKHQIVAYIRCILDPFFKSGAIDKQTYKTILQKSSAKVMAAHPDSADSGFLIAESDKIHKLVKAYLMQMQQQQQQDPSHDQKNDSATGKE